MNTEALYYCLDIANTKSFTKTAEKNHISQQAVSQQIKNLEWELGFQIFERSNRTVSVTAAGQMFLDEIEGILGWLKVAADKARAFADSERHSIRLGFNGPTSKKYLNRVLSAFHDTYPNVPISFALDSNQNLVNKVTYGVYDMIAIGDFFEFAGDEFYSIKWKSGNIAAVVGKTHPFARLESVAPEQLLQEEYLTLSLSKDSAMRQRSMERAKKVLGKVPPKIRYVEDTDSIDIMLASGRGFTLLNDQLADTYHTDTLKFVAVDGPKVSHHVHFIWRKDNKNPALPLFIEKAEEIGLLVTNEEKTS